MLEPLVSSRIRRTLLEFLANDPTERFYLRGLAKHLALPITPLRRELKRLEAAGMLHGSDEGNIRFYTVDTASPAFRQLRQMVAGAAAPVAPSALAASLPMASAAVAVARPARRAGLFVVVTAAGLLVLLTAAALTYTAMTGERVMRQISRLNARPVTAVAAPASAAGTMRGQHWQIVPGGFGGVSAAGPASEEAY